MNLDPLAIAARHIHETRELLETLIKSSESFDYPKAKLALGALRKKSAELAKLQTALSGERAPAANIVRLNFDA